jgi:hypothetical protein
MWRRSLSISAFAAYILTTPKFVFSFGIDIDAAPLDQTEPTEFAERFRATRIRRNI